MKFERIPYHLRHSIEEIVAHARKNITIHYQNSENTRFFSIGCQIIDHNDYSVYFYEPKKFEILEPKTIKCIDQRSAHQNAIIALKKWEGDIREFLTKPTRKMENLGEKSLEKMRRFDRPSRIEVVISSAGGEQKNRRVRRVPIH